MQNDEIVTRLQAIFDLPIPILIKRKDLPPRPPHLFHFTDCGGLVGVLREGSLWASLATALNDLSELQYAIERSRHLLTTGAIAADPRFLRSTAKALDPLYTSRAIKIEWRVYVVSFCADAESALHWLHYGRAGTGMALRFDAASLDAPGFDLLPVMYEQDAQDALLKQLLEGAWQSTEKALRDVPEDSINAMILAAGELAANNIWLAAPIMKDPAFRGENEWRLFTFEPYGLALPSGAEVVMKTHFRSTAGRVVPYKEIKYSPLPMTCVILGASAGMEPHDMGLAVLSEEALGKRIEVVRSAVSVRP